MLHYWYVCHCLVRQVDILQTDNSRLKCNSSPGNSAMCVIGDYKPGFIMYTNHD